MEDEQKKAARNIRDELESMVGKTRLDVLKNTKFSKNYKGKEDMVTYILK